MSKQFEILSILLLRECFQAFVRFDEPISWTSLAPALGAMLTDALGGLAIFIVVGFFYRAQRHRRITLSSLAQSSFRSTKRVLALVLLLAFVLISLHHGQMVLRGEDAEHFFDTFFTTLIFSDILLIFISLRYTASYPVVFRNSGYGLATVFIRLAVTAPPFLNVGLGVGAALFAMGLTLAYNQFTPLSSVLSSAHPAPQEKEPHPELQ